MKRLCFMLYGMTLTLLFTALIPQSLNAQINIDGNEHRVDAIGQTLDISMPSNDNIAFITFKLTGADGGYAQVLDHIGKKTVKANGGSGAFITATFLVGNGLNEIPPGSIFRFMEGRSGENGSSSATVGAGFDYGGGGGGSGILYKENSTSPYKLLAIAGGGGGAYQGMVAGSSVDHKPGQSGRTGTNGGSGNEGSYSNSGGVDGHDGGDKSVGDGGGARKASSSIRTSAYTHENCDDCTLPGSAGIIGVTWRAGGTGYGCGGHGLGAAVIGSGGGGGGYSGGGFGGTAGRGGGGGSFVNALATSESFTDQGTNPTPDHGWITYQVTLNQPPVAQCKTATIYLDGIGKATLYASDIDNGSSDPEGSIANRSLSKISFDCDDKGPNQVTLTVTDDMGSTATCNAIVNMMDARVPIALCQNITVYLDANGDASIVPADVDDGSFDNCGIASMNVVPNSFTCSNTSAPVEVTLTVTDNNDNVSICTSTVTVEDNIVPDVICQNITIQLDAFGNASIVSTDIDNGSTDACGIASYAVSKTDFTCADLGNNTVTLTVTDVNDNSTNCNANVRVEDNTAPIVKTQDVTVILDKQGNGRVTPNMIDNGSTDNCNVDSMWLVGEIAYDCGNTGEHEVVLKARDQSGNIGSYNAFVTVIFYEPDFKNIHDVANGDTIHRVDCQVPRDISRCDLDYETVSQHGTITTNVYKAELPENAPWDMYAVWRYEYVVKDACYHTFKFNYYLALYDLAPPIFQNFPDDITVATSVDVPEVDKKVKNIDVCQYVVWDTVMTMPVLNQQSGDTLGYSRRWMARDPSGHESFRDQMIWLGSGDRNQYSMITGRIAGEDHMANAQFAGEAGTNGLPVSLYRLDTVAGTRTWVNSWTTGDWMGAQGTYYFVPEHPGSYQVKIDTAICLVDTLKFNKWLWSDTLTVAAGESLNQGWIISYDCIETDTTIIVDENFPEALAEVNDVIQSQVSSNTEWRVYPNPASGYLKIDFNRDDAMNYQIYNARGRSVKTGVYQQGETIDIRGLNAGLYHLQLRDQKEILGMKSILMSSDF